MIGKGLSLDQSPPFTASLRFFLTGPLFLIIAAIVFCLSDINPFERWLPNTIGVIHFFNLGFLVMVMMGALTQMSPVLAGIRVPNVLWVSRIVHALLSLGALLFPLGLIQMNQTMIQIGFVSAWTAILIFYSIMFIALQKGIASFTLTSFKLSSLSALVTLVLAGRLAWGYSFGEFSLYRTQMIELHIAWAFFGMTFTLLMGVSYKVVPMFFVTSDHPKWLSHYGSKIIFALLSLWTLIFQTFILENFVWLQSLIPVIKFLLSTVVICFSFTTIMRLNNRKRPITDTSILYWKLSMILFIVGSILFCVSQLVSESDLFDLFATINFGLAILSLITGMLYKIIPFLTWFHLTSKGVSRVPTMRELLSDRHARKQLYLHIGMILGLVLAVVFPQTKWLWGLLLSLSMLAMLFVLHKPLKIYRKISTPV